MKAPFRLACIVLALAIAPALADQGGLRYSITVTKFENRSAFPEGQFALAQTFTAVLTDSLQKTGKFIVLGEKDMRIEAIGEQDFGASGRVAKAGRVTVEQVREKLSIARIIEGERHDCLGRQRLIRRARTTPS